MWKIFAIFVLAITTTTHSISPVVNEDIGKNLPFPENRQQEPTYRLPTNVRPSKYTLDIYVDADSEYFSGNVTINLEVTVPTTSIHLNYKDIFVGWSDARLVLDASAETFPVIREVDRPIEQIYELHFDRSLVVGVYTLDLTFAGFIRHDLTGLYKSSYSFTNDSLSETR